MTTSTHAPRRAGRRSVARAIGAGLAGLALAGPAAAQSPAPTFAFDVPCASPASGLGFSGTGYTPGGEVDLLFVGEGRIGSYPTHADAAGAIAGRVGVPDPGEFRRRRVRRRGLRDRQRSDAHRAGHPARIAVRAGRVPPVAVRGPCGAAAASGATRALPRRGLRRRGRQAALPALPPRRPHAQDDSARDAARGLAATSASPSAPSPSAPFAPAPTSWCSRPPGA